MGFAAALVFAGIGMLVPGFNDLVESLIKQVFGLTQSVEVPWWVGLILISLGLIILVMFYWRKPTIAVPSANTANPNSIESRSPPPRSETGLAFKISAPQQAQRVVQLAVGAKLKVGRDASNDIVLAGDRTVSRFHCLIAVFGDHVYVQDLAATNAIQINGIEVREGTVQLRDKIGLGATVLALIPWTAPLA
jgi:hypothetical protein